MHGSLREILQTTWRLLLYACYVEQFVRAETDYTH